MHTKEQETALRHTMKVAAVMSVAALTLGYLPDAVTLDIYDDGAGFEPAAAAPPSTAGGYGLRAMRQRVEQLGGIFSVHKALPVKGPSWQRNCRWRSVNEQYHGPAGG